MSEVVKSAELSHDGLYRYRLLRLWGTGGRVLPFVMLNPSTADHRVDDPTIRRCMGFARGFGYDGIEVVNLYAYRATSPTAMFDLGETLRHPSAPWGITGGPRNDETIRATLSRAWWSDIPVVAAWGANARPDRVAWLMDLGGIAPVVTERGRRGLHALKVTKAGAPGHPLYIRGDAQLVPYPGGPQ